MNVKEWVQAKTTSRTAFEFFSECWGVVFQKPCASNQIVIDANKYNRRGDIPYYVHRRFEMNQRARVVMPAQAEKTSRWMDSWNHQAYRLVSEQSAVLVAHKGLDGVWRS